MAKKEEKKPLVKCEECAFGGREVINFLLDCNNSDRNPNGYKVGRWERECKYFQKRWQK